MLRFLVVPPQSPLSRGERSIEQKAVLPASGGLGGTFDSVSPCTPLKRGVSSVVPPTSGGSTTIATKAA